MKNFSTLLIFSLLLSGCAFVDEAAITKKEAITPADFIEKSMTESGLYTGTSSESGITREDLISSGVETSTGSGGSGSNVSIKKSSTGTGAISTSDLTLSGSDEQDSLLKSTSDKDVENLINSLFDSTEL